MANTQTTVEATGLTKKDFISEGDVKWCPGCGDYAILASVQTILPTLGIPKEDFCFVSGIGCSSRFPYYVSTFGFHTVHGRAPTVATGVKIANPNLSTWLVTGDGDGLSIGGNHFMHMIRRNQDIKVLLFDNRIYGLTKGQYSPTSEKGKVTKTSLSGSIENPINPVSLAIASGATFVARTNAANPKHMQEVLKAAAKHKGTAVIHILQNCVIFNDGAFEKYINKESKEKENLFLEDGKALLMTDDDYGIKMVTGSKPHLELVETTDKSHEGVLVHDPSHEDTATAYLVGQMGFEDSHLPTAMGVIRCVTEPTYHDSMVIQEEEAVKKKGEGEIKDLIYTPDTWTINPDGVESKLLDA